MSPIQCELRRATLDDLANLRALWSRAGLSAATLEKHLTEFQVAEAIEGHLLACIGLHLEGRDGRVHSETYRTPEIQPELERRLWDRAQTVAQNHGLCRLWTQEQNPLQTARGFHEADESVLKKLPAKFRHAKEPWLVLTLREEIIPAISLEHEFGLFKQSQMELTDRALRQARILRVIALIITILFVGFAFWIMWRVIRNWPALSKPSKP